MIKCVITSLLLTATYMSNAASVQALDNCNTPINTEPLYTVLGSNKNTLYGWSHVEKLKPDGEYRSLNLDDKGYKISQENYKQDESCDSEKVQNAVLVVKLSDWTRQHSNGIEASLNQRDLSFGEATGVLMDIRINSVDTQILGQDGIIARYAPYLSTEQFNSFDKGKVNLGITLFENQVLDQATESFKLEYLVEIDQSLYFDRWVRVVVPLAEFRAYTEKDYQRVDRQLIDFQKTKIQGIRITPETRNGSQLRNLLGEKWSSEIPETFKEISISLRRIELL